MSQHYIAWLGRHRLLQNDTLTPADDKRQHATAIDGQRDAHTLLHQSDGFLYNLIVV